MDWRFSIWIDGELLTREAIQGKTITRSANLPGVGPVTLRITVMDSPKEQSRRESSRAWAQRSSGSRRCWERTMTR